MLTETHGMQLADYVSVLRRRAWLVVLVTLVVVGTALAVSLIQTPVYQARARLLLERNQAPFEAPSALVDFGLVQTEIEVIQSEPVQAEVRKRIGAAPRVSAFPVGQTSVIEVRAENTNPARAALISNTYIEAYIDYRRNQAVNSLFATGQQLQAKVASLQQEIDTLAAQIAEIPPCVGENPPPGCSAREALQRDRDTKIAQQVPFKQKLDQLQVDAALKDGGAKLSSPAVAPSEPIRPRPVRNTLLGLGTGLVLSIALAFLFEHLDDSIKTKEELERLIPGVPVLGLIPTVPGWKKGETLVVSKTAPNSPPAEAYRTLRTSIGFAGLDRPMQVMQVTSAAASEGKTTTSANLAVALARAGKRVIVLSADLRRPRIHEFFGLSNDVGFTSVLLGEANLQEACQTVPNEPRIMLLGSGPIPPNPSELLASARTDKVLAAMRTSTDFVVLDSPPLLPVTDAAVLGAKVDSTLLVITAGTTTRRQLTRAVELLRQVGAPVVGSVLNAVSTEGAYGYGRYYHDYHGPPSTNGNGSRRARKARRRLRRET